MQKPYLLSSDKVAIQVGRTVVTFAQKLANPEIPATKKLPSSSELAGVSEKKKKSGVAPTGKVSNNAGEIDLPGKSSNISQNCNKPALNILKENQNFKQMFNNMDI